MDTVGNRKIMQKQWDNYQKDFEYAMDVAFLFYVKTESKPIKMPLHGYNPSSGVSLFLFYPVQQGILICWSFIHSILQNSALLFRRFFIPEPIMQGA